MRRQVCHHLSSDARGHALEPIFPAYIKTEDALLLVNNLPPFHGSREEC